VYDRNGKIAGANKLFRTLAGISPDDIQSGAVNFFELLNGENTVFIEAAHNAFDGKEKVYEDVGLSLRAEPGTAEYRRLVKLPNAIFFPMSRDRDGISLAGILLDKNKTEDDTG